MKSSLLIILASGLIFSNCGSKSQKSTPPTTDDTSISTTATGTLNESATSIILPDNVTVVISGTFNPAV